ncbi:DUF1365 domain-containing protein [Variovorax sp. PAMC28562]|uniref:DUF1365 domain-containing protein n=1 Tax=Variovorax sp. PAMC28562 TaxID=2762323 RepID=UPI00164E42D5|nr:DUF1365 domain-containing protein [Variovorax sp. PAMC28562]QNK73105.1 DUF1365 domain-containing protein [Variovorax sp. PAMC28562]
MNTTLQQSALYPGRVMHQRMRPARHRLAYRVFSLLIDLDELPELAQRLRFFSLNRFNLFSLHEADYGARKGKDGNGHNLRQRVDEQLTAAGLLAGGPIRLLSMPRILGYAFNPLSVYFCHLPDGELQAILYEVNNTFGERHSYLIEVDKDQRALSTQGVPIDQHCAKEFHVSPFLGLQMDYGFRVQAPHVDQPEMRLDITASDADGPMLFARLDAHRRVLNDAALLLAFFSHPLLTLKVVGAIHWEALRLWVKGVRLHVRPPAPTRSVTVTKAEES